MDFDNFCDMPYSNKSTFKLTKKINNNTEHLESEGICNIYTNTNKNMKKYEMTKKINDALKDAKDSSDE